MTVTEAFEWVTAAAETMVQKADEQRMKDEGIENLRRALKRVQPRVQRMRARLDFARARRAGKLNRPSWATP